MTFEARLLMEPYIIENYSKYIDMDKLLDLEEQTKKILSSDILEQKDAVVFCNIDDALHRTIADACKNKYLNMNLSQIYDQNPYPHLRRTKHLGTPQSSRHGALRTDQLH